MTDTSRRLEEATVLEGNADVPQDREMTPAELAAEVRRQQEISLKLESASSRGRFVHSMKKIH